MDSPCSISHWLPCSPLGSGSFGNVSLALNLDDSSLFAVKSAHSSSPQELFALQNELRILQTLDSPFIIRLLGADFYPSSESSHPVPQSLFLEYMDSGSLSDVLRQCGGKFQQQRRVRRFTRSILQGLCYLHQHGIVHCDIKSQNILIGSSGVKIADFGAAGKVGEECSPVDGNLKGTPLWMAPEVAQGAEPLPSSDIWSLGCTVVEMLQGRPPWGHVQSLAAALFKVGCSEENPPLPETISAEAKDFLLKCLDRDADARWTAAKLLNHSFVCGMEGDSDGDGDTFGDQMVDQPSPRSTLDFFNGDSESESEDESVMEVVPALLHFPATMKVQSDSGPERPEVVSMHIPQGSSWIVVKRREGWCEGRQAPFMQAGSAAGREEVLPVKKGREVSFASAEFLRRRRGADVYVVG